MPGSGEPTPGGVPGGDAAGVLVPGDYSPRITGWFSNWVRGMFRKRFNSVRVAAGSANAASDLAEYPGPVIVLLNHASWWDPLTCMIAASAWMPGRTPAAPMDASQLAKFRFFRKLGIFGVNPDDAASLRAMNRYVLNIFRTADRPTLWITPQGRFTDVREPVVVRPGAASVAAAASRDHIEEPAAHQPPRVLSLAVEYTFWHDQRPEVFLRAQQVPPPDDAGSTGAWRRAMESAMNANAAALAESVSSRDPARFEHLFRGSGAGTNPLYDLWLRIRGRSARLDVEHRTAAKDRGVRA